ncbi:uncharacterized protein V2V93DRAFT_401422 [Kockiozyma suomiensis]|uniref:uncharacterized protein n=1 Tax=Kockiozyma suomiensis TaxID=1337062 RepID=UPI0033431923
MAEESSSAPITPLKYKQTQGSYVLAKPFRSPLKRPVRSYDLQSTPDASSFVCQYSAESSPSSVQIGDFGRDSEDSMVIKSSKFREKFLSIANNERKTIDPILIKQESSLDLTIRHLRSRLQQISQAAKHEQATVILANGANVSKEESLIMLTDRWRTASQSAAKYLFDLAQARVAKMGGVSEFKRRSRKRGFDGDDDEEDERKKRIEQMGELEYQRIRDEKAEDDQEEEFTMEMMLTALNVDYHLVFTD